MIPTGAGPRCHRTPVRFGMGGRKGLAGRLLPGTGLLSMMLIGCAHREDVESETESVTRRDSLGIVIIEVPYPPRAPLPEWTVSGDPILSVGDVEGDDPYLFQTLVGAHRTRDGGVVVANEGSGRDLRFFDSQGRFVRSSGRTGSGPGEFRRLSGLFRYRGDSLAVWDEILKRLTVFDQTGALGRTIDLSRLANARYVYPVAGMADGRFLSVPSGLQVLRLNVREGWHWARIDGVSESGDSFDALAELQQHRVLLDRDGLPQIFRFQGGGEFLPCRDGFGWSRSDLGEILFHDREGRPASRLRLLARMVPVDQEHLERVIAWMRASGRSERDIELQRRRFRELPRADFLPVFLRAYRDPAGLVWLDPYPPDPAEDPPFVVLDPEKGWVGTVAIPPGAFLLEIGDAYLILRRRDSMGVEHVDVHRLERGPGWAQGKR